MFFNFNISAPFKKKLAPCSSKVNALEQESLGLLLINGAQTTSQTAILMPSGYLFALFLTNIFLSPGEQKGAVGMACQKAESFLLQTNIAIIPLLW